MLEKRGNEYWVSYNEGTKSVSLSDLLAQSEIVNQAELSSDIEYLDYDGEVYHELVTYDGCEFLITFLFTAEEVSAALECSENQCDMYHWDAEDVYSVEEIQ